MQIDLTGRSALITGGSTGLGLAMAKRLSASGADVAILARRADVIETAVTGIEKTAKGKVAGFPCDVSKAEPLQHAFGGAMSAFGKIDIVINNAGISRAMPFLETTDEGWQDDLDLKLFAAIRLARLAMPQMGPDHQCAEYRREGAARRLRPHLRLARRRDGADQGARRGRGAA